MTYLKCKRKGMESEKETLISVSMITSVERQENDNIVLTLVDMSSIETDYPFEAFLQLLESSGHFVIDMNGWPAPLIWLCQPKFVADAVKAFGPERATEMLRQLVQCNTPDECLSLYKRTIEEHAGVAEAKEGEA